MMKRKTSPISHDIHDTPWKKLCFDDVEDKYLYTEPSLCLKRTKNVHFSDREEIVEVPSRSYYIQEGIQLWWSRHEMAIFYRDSIPSTA